MTAAAPTASTGTARARRSRECSRIWRTTIRTRIALITYMLMFMPSACRTAPIRGVSPRAGVRVDTDLDPRVDPGRTRWRCSRSPESRVEHRTAGSTLGRLSCRRQQQAELTATAAASGKQRRLATANNTRTIRRNLRYVRPETEGRGSAPRTCSCRQYFCQAPWQRLTGGGRYGTSPSPRPATDGPGRLGCHLRDSRSRTINVAAAGEPLTKPKNGPKSCAAEKPVTYKPSRLVWKASSSTGKPLDTLTCLSTPAR